MGAPMRSENLSIIEVEGIFLTPLKIIDVPEGDVLHGMKSSDKGYSSFGEAYFSMVLNDKVKAWKRHRTMSLNLIVPVGEIRFVIYDDRQDSKSFKTFSEVSLSRDFFYRLTIPPMLWMGMQGKHKDTNLLLNIANIEHDPSEVDRKKINDFNFDWGKSK